MKIFLVGGAVRDHLLGRPVQDRDWVVVGGSPDTMRAEGYQQVGADFPVFLHPRTGEEHALARTERRSGVGHKGFITDFSPEVTLEQDLLRRDLTINAMAMTPDGEIIDPYGGCADLESGWLRAVSPAFAEDPLRVFRVARFAAQFPPFRIHPDTLELMRSMTAQGRLAELPGERVWRELDKATNAPAPDRFVDTLASIDAFEPFFREWTAVRPAACAEDFSGRERLAIWCEALAEKALRAMSARLKAPNHVRDFLLHVEVARPSLLHWRETTATELAAVLVRLRAFQDPALAWPVFDFIERRHRIDLCTLRTAIGTAARQIGASQFEGLTGPALGAAILQARAALIGQAQRDR